MTTPTRPSGAQHVLTRGDQTAVVTEVGATLRSYEVAGRAVLDGFAEDARPDGGRGQVLAPWPNRVRDGRWTLDGSPQQLPITEVPNGNAIHGLVRWVGWSLDEASTADRVVLTTTVWPQPGYPFLLRLAAAYALDDDGLTVELSARNDGTAPAPYGVGQHPYLTVGVPVDSAVLTVPANRRLVLDERSLPVGVTDVEEPYDFRTPRVVGDLQLDDAFVDLVADDDGVVRVRLEETRSGRGVELWADGATTHCLQVFSGDTLPDPARRRQGLAVEPMSCAADAFRSGTDLVVLEPGASHSLRWGVRALPAS